jgi:hypothetical protein
MLLFAALLGCPNDTDTSFEDTSVDCPVTIDKTHPLDGATDAYYRSAIEFHLSEPDPTALVIADFDGIQTDRGGGSIILFTPTAPLDPETTYTVGLEYCRGAPSIEFTTSALGTALTDPAALVGRTFTLDMLQARFVAGAEVAATAATLFDRNLLASVLGLDGDWLRLRLGKALADDTGNQDFCARTVDLPPADVSNLPWFHLLTDELQFGAYAADMSLYQLQVSGTFSADGSAIGGLTMKTVVDSRDIATLISGQTADSLCEIMGNLYIPCEPCPTDGYSYCFNLSFEDLSGTPVDSELESVESANTDSRCEIE